MFKVTFKFESGEDVTTFAQEGENLLEVARLTNVAIDAPCGGNASCGKCKVKLVEGELHSPKTRHISDLTVFVHGTVHQRTGTQAQKHADND